MSNFLRYFIAVACVLGSYATYAQPGAITVIKGVDGIPSDANNVPDSTPCFNSLSHFAKDNSGNYYTFNAGNSTIRKVDATTHLVTTITGTGTSGYSGDGGPANLAQISNMVAGIVTDDTGNIIFIDNDRIRKISIATGNIYTLYLLGTDYANDICIDKFNNIFTCHFSSSRVKKYNSLTGTQTVLASMNGAYRIANDTAGNIYCVGNGKVLKINSTGDTTWVAGRGYSGYYGGDGGAAREANFYSVCAIQVDDSANIYVIDRPNAGRVFTSPVIRKIDAATGMIHKIGFGIYDDASAGTEPRPYLEYSNGDNLTFLRLNTGQFLVNTGTCIKQLAHEYCPIDSIFVMDTLLSPPGELATFGISISGTLKGRPSSGSGYIEIRTNLGAGGSGGFMLPYYPVINGTTGDTVYHFGDREFMGPHFAMSTYHYTMPGIYHPYILVTSVGGYRDFVGFPSVRASTNDATTTRALHITNIDDTITSEPCVFPATVTRNIKGYVIASSITAADSVYAEVDNDDGTSEILVRQLQGPGTWPGETTWTIASDSIYYFNITYTHAYAARYASPYDPTNPAYGYNCKVHAVTNGGTGDDLEYKTGNISSHYFSEFQCQGSCNTTHVLSCDTPAITNITVYSIHDSVITPCGLPATTACTVKGFVAGYVSPTDSVFLEITNGNDSIVAAIMIPINRERRAGAEIPYAEMYDSVCLFSYTFTGPFGGSSYNTVVGTWPTGVNAYYGSRIVTARTNTGITSDPVDAEWLGDGVLIESCDRNYVSAFSSFLDYGNPLCVPFTGNFFFQGSVQGDLAATSVPSFPVYFNLGDGFDTVIIANSWAEGTASPGVFSIGFDHTYTIPGHYVVTAYIDTSIVPMHLQDIYHDALDVSPACSPVSGTFFIDNNYNCIADSGEIRLGYWPFLLVNNTTGDTTNQWCDAAGNYNIGVTVGNNYTVIGTHPSYFDGESAADSFTAVCPSSGAFSFDATEGVPVTQNFGLNCAGTAASVDMAVSGWASNIIPARTGNIVIAAGNGWGYTCGSLSATVTLIKDHRLTYAGMFTGSPLPDVISGDTLRWNLSTVSGLFEFNANVKVICDTFATAADSMHNTVIVSPTSLTDPALANNTYSWATRVRTSLDPNDKDVSPKGFGPEGYIENGTPLSYIIRFENKGTASAENVTIADSLSDALDMGTLEVINSSAAVEVYHIDNSLVKFRFNNINLPDSASDPEGSKGFVMFRILPKDNLAPLTTIENKAKIYFDYNPAVVTNTTMNTIEETLEGISGADAVCIGAEITLSNSVTGGIWAATNGNTTVSASGVVTGIHTGVDTISYTVYGDKTVFKIISVSLPADAGTITGTPSVCATSSTTLSNTVAGGTWSSSSATATIDGGVVTGIAMGTTIISYSISNGCGTAVDTMLFTVDPLPDAGIITGTPSVCPAATTTLSNSATGGTWNSSSSSATVVGGVVTGASAGTTVISYSVTNACGTAVDTMMVTVNPLPDAGTITGTPSVCPAATTTLSNAATGGTWSSSSSAATVAGGMVTGATAGTAIISYSVTNICGTAVDTMLFTVNPLPDAGTISGTPSVCATATTTLSNAATGGTWASSSSAATVVGGVVTGATAGTTVISYSVTNICGTAVDTMLFTVNPLPDAGTITGVNTICSSATTTLTSTITGGTWSSSTTDVMVAGGIVTGTATGTAIISYAVTNVCGTATDTMEITVLPLPDAGTLTGSAFVCIGSQTTLSTTATGGSWSSSTADATVVDGVVSGITSGSAIITYSVSNSCGTATDTMTIAVSPVADAGTISGSSAICVAATGTLTSSVSGGAWSTTGTHTGIAADGTVTAVSAGTDTVIYIVSTACGTDTATLAVTVLSAPSAGSILGTDSLCQDAAMILTESVGGGIWFSSNSSAATINSTGLVTGITPGSTVISYVVSNTCGTDTAYYSVYIVPVGDCNTGIAGTTSTQSITIYPNPTSGTFTVQIPGAVNNASITITDVSGKVLQVLHLQQGQHQTQVSLSNLASGTYMVKVEADGVQYRDKLVLW